MATSDCDGDDTFGVAAGLTRFSHWFRNVPERSIVGIGYAMETSDAFAVLGLAVELEQN
jgi:uncharacterized protein